MDCRRTCAGVLTAAALLLLVAASPAPDPPLRAARWLAPGVAIGTLGRQPTECLSRPSDSAGAEAVTIGRAAFRTPLLLGGQAARAGLSCAACHRNGRGNPHFLFPGVSGAPGTADVTSSLFSSHRGDGKVNPRKIPDLAGPAKERIVSRDPGTRALENFIRGLIVEEFDGPPPTPRVLAGLAAYVRALSPNACPNRLDEAASLDNDLAAAEEGARAAVLASREKDRTTARLMLASARASLALIDERYAALTPARRLIRDSDLELAAIQRAVDQGADDIPLRIAAWRINLASMTRILRRDERRSLFNPARLAARNIRTP